MLRKLIGLGLLLFAALAQAAGPKEGEPAPRLTATTLSGQHFDSAALRGKVVVIAFWATWCTYCRQELADLDAFQHQHGKAGLEVLAVNMDEPETVAQVPAIARTWNFPSALQAKTAAAGYGRIWRLPLTFVIDRKGVLRRDGWDSETAVSRKQMDEVLLPLLREAG
ncbi:MAG TPA: TlpA disulfide reductase family protein [Rhodocyclaceae bacterium]